jgi:hypothetical protein
MLLCSPCCNWLIKSTSNDKSLPFAPAQSCWECRRWEATPPAIRSPADGSTAIPSPGACTILGEFPCPVIAKVNKLTVTKRWRSSVGRGTQDRRAVIGRMQPMEGKWMASLELSRWMWILDRTQGDMSSSWKSSQMRIISTCLKRQCPNF